jgi:hypothetical protein
VKLTLQRKVSLGVLGLTAAVLVADQVLRAGRSGAAHVADAVELALADARQMLSSGTLLDPGRLLAAAPSEELAQRIETLGRELGVDPGLAQDAFRPPQGWIRKPQATTDASAGPDQGPRLKAIMTGRGGAAYALLDLPGGGTKMLRVGESAEGLTLVEAGGLKARFRRESGEVVEMVVQPKHGPESGVIAAAGSDSTPGE